eukprot:g2852.t1
MSSLAKAGLTVVTGEGDKSSSSTVKDFIRQVRNVIVKKKIRLTEMFKDFDKMHSGKITRGQFLRGIYAIGLPVSDEHAKQLLAIYRDQSDEYDESVRYLDFCNQVEEAFSTKGLVRSPRKASPRKWNELEGANRQLNLSAKENEDLANLISSLKKKVDTHRIATKVYFQDFDKFNRGFVTEARFRRALFPCFQVHFSEDTIELLCKVYELETQATAGQSDSPRKTRYINYRDFVGDVDPKGAVGGSGKGPFASSSSKALDQSPKRVTKSIVSGPETDVDAVEENIVTEIVSKRVPVKGALRDFDELRTGYCTIGQFKRAIVTCGLRNATEVQLTALANKYLSSSNDGMVCYADFLHVVTTAAQSRVEKLSTLRTAIESNNGTSSAAAAAVAGKSAVDLENEAPEVRAVLRQIKDSMNRNRYSFQDLFSDFDRRHQNKITRTQFKRVLAFYDIIYLVGEDAIEAILDRFADDENANLVRYNDFVAVLVDRKPSSDESAIESEASVVLAKSAPAAADLDAIIRRIKGVCKRRRIRMREFLQDFDPLRRGVISRAELQKGCSIAGLHLSPDEAATLADAYRADLTDLGGRPYVRWVELTNNIESVFTSRDLERNPKYDVTQSVQTSRQGIDQNERPQFDMTDAEITDLVAIMRRVAKSSKPGFAIDVAQAFKDFDKSHKGSVTPAQFDRAMRSANVRGASGVEMEKLKSAFKVEKNYVMIVSYRSFLEALKRVMNNEPRPFQVRDRHCVKEHANFGGARRPPNREAVEFETKTSAEEVLRDMADFAAANRIRLGQFLYDYDSFRRGYIPSGKLQTALSSAGFKRVDGGDVRLLEDKFRHPHMSDMVEYAGILSVVDPSARPRGR